MTTISLEIPNCHTEINAQCVQCNVGYTLTPNSTCTLSCPALPHCATCDDSTGQSRCDACMPAYYPLPFGSGCSPSPYCAVPDCTSCSTASSGLCVECNSGYVLSKDGQCKRKIPFWFWIALGCGLALILALILYAVLHKGEPQEEWAQKIRSRAT
jgi:hypothetical protein